MRQQEVVAVPPTDQNKESTSMPSDCESCGGTIVDAYQLPGGEVVHANDVAFTDNPLGVDATRVCNDCGRQFNEA